MKLRVLRNVFSDKSTIGELHIDDSPFCFTLELPNKDGQHGSCISAGSYQVVIVWSERFQRAMPRIVNVRMRDGILLHWGNYPHDTDGCILVGANYNNILPDFIGNSRVMFNKLFVILANAPSITIDIIGGFTIPPDLPPSSHIS